MLDRERLLVLPVAHDALTARLIERAGFPAYQIGGFASVAAANGVPDIDLIHYDERSEISRRIIGATRLPAMVDADDGYGDVKNVVRTVQGYEHLGASALFLEDQVAPKKCGHMENKRVVPVELMVGKVKAAVNSRDSKDFFILARTDAIQPEGLENAIERAKRYLDAGADGAYLEGPRTVEELEKIGKALKGVPLATSILEGGGKTPDLKPSDLHEMGFTMLLYPTTLLFSMTKCLQAAIERLKEHKPMTSAQGVDMEEFLEIVDMPFWQGIEKKFEPHLQ